MATSKEYILTRMTCIDVYKHGYMFTKNVHAYKH
jgi:hypothetical protein